MTETNSFKGVQTAERELPPSRWPGVLGVLGVLALAGGAVLAMGRTSATESVWASTARASSTPCTLERGGGAIPEVVAVGCHPSEMVNAGVLPVERLRWPAASVSMLRNYDDGELMLLSLEGARVTGEELASALDAMAPEGAARGSSESFELPDGWPGAESWEHEGGLPTGEPGAMHWAQSPGGDISCVDGEVAGVATWQGSDRVLLMEFREKRSCLWRQMQRRNGFRRGGAGGMFRGF